MNISGKLLEEKHKWRSPFLIKLIACSFAKNFPTMDNFMGVFRDDCLLSKHIFTLKIFTWSNIGVNFKLTCVFEHFG